MDFESYYEIAPTAHFIRSRSFTRVALQFPDELLKDSVRVVRALRDELQSLESDTEGNGDDREVQFFVMADTTYGSCCVDEVGASHASAECVIHYGHTCLSPTSTLPAFLFLERLPSIFLIVLIIYLTMHGPMASLLWSFLGWNMHMQCRISKKH